MKKYHIVYFEKKGEIYSKGFNVEEKSAIAALNKFEQQFPDSIFYCLIVKD